MRIWSWVKKKGGGSGRAEAQQNTSPPRVEPLEPRLLLSADPLGIQDLAPLTHDVDPESAIVINYVPGEAETAEAAPAVNDLESQPIAPVELPPFERIEPLGSLMYQTRIDGDTDTPGDFRDFSFFAASHETVSAVATPDDPTVALGLRFNGDEIRWGESGRPIALQPLAVTVTGDQAITVVADGQTSFSLDVYLNSAPESLVGDSRAGNPLNVDGSFVQLGSGRWGLHGSMQDESTDSLVWGVQPATGQILGINPQTGLVGSSFSAPGNLMPEHTQIGLTVAEDGASLLYVNSDDAPGTLYRLDAMGSYQESDPGAGSVSGGVARGWTQYGSIHQLSLPWTFEYFGVGYDAVWVSTFGYLDFVSPDSDFSDYDNSTEELIANVRIAPLWDDLITELGDIYVEFSNPEAVSIRWQGRTFDTFDPVDFMATLRQDGSIRFDYGAAHSGLTPTIGLSAGNGLGYTLSERNGSDTIPANVASLFTFAGPGTLLSVETIEPQGIDGLGFDRTGGGLDVLFAETMDASPAGWTLDPGNSPYQWQWGIPTGGGSVDGDPSAGFTGDAVLGYNLDGDYANDTFLPEYATTPAIDTSDYTDVTLSFYRWLGVEGAPYDTATIEVSNDGASWTTVWESDEEVSDYFWTLQTVDISAIANDQATVYVRWGMGPADDSFAYPGWNIDDVQITGRPVGGADPTKIFLGHDGWDIHRQDGFSGPETADWATGAPTGALGGDGVGRQFGFFSDGMIREYDPATDTDGFLNEFPAPAPDVEGMAFDGSNLYVSTAAGDLYTLDPDDGNVENVVSISGGGLFGLGAWRSDAPIPMSDTVDLYTLDLTGKVGHVLDIVLAGQDSADFSGERLELLDADGNVLATGTPTPLDPTVSAANFALGILNLVVPADGRYALRLTSATQGAYGIVITEALIFDTEPNNAISDPLRSLDPAHGALGFLGGTDAIASDSADEDAPAVEPAGPEANAASDADAPQPGANAAPSEQVASDAAATVEATAQRAVIRFQDTLSDDDIAAWAEANGVHLVHRLTAVFNGAVVEFDRPLTEEAIQSTLAAWSASSEVVYAEFASNDIQSLAAPTFPDDPLFSQQWAWDNIGQTGGTPDADIDAPEAWGIATGAEEVVIAIIDSGVNYLHPDLAPVMWVNPGEIAGNGIDDDGNGYIDDIHGINARLLSGDPMDDRGHGTHVAGTAAAAGNNGEGVTGVNWNVRIMAVKLLDAQDSIGTYADAVIAMDYVTLMKTTYGVNVVVSNSSWGRDEFGQALEDAVAALIDAGILFVAAAGNSGGDTDLNPFYPSSLDLAGVISVAATDHHDLRAAFSNYGAQSVDLGAPGVDILSTMLEWGFPGLFHPSGYGLLSGTSMAAPHVAGAAALIASQWPGLSVLQIKQALLAGVDPVAGLQGITVTGGRLNLHQALTATGGHVAFDGDAYDVGDPVALELIDFDLAGTGRVPVELTTTSGDVEQVWLDETGIPGVFAGTLATTQGSPSADSGLLEIPIDDVVTVTYDNAADITGQPAKVTDGARMTLAVAAGGDFYTLDLVNGEIVELHTELPFADPNHSPLNTLDSRLIVYGPSGKIMGEDDNSLDGRNAYVQFVAPEIGTYYVGVYAVGGQGEYLLFADVTPDTHAPADIVLSHRTIAENEPAGTLVGLFSTFDETPGDAHTYTLVAGHHAKDNAAFTLVGNELRTNQSFDFEADRKYTLRVRSTDLGGLTVERVFRIKVADVNEAPTVNLRHVLTALPEHLLTNRPIKVADIRVRDDALGEARLSLGGADADLFEIRRFKLYLKAGVDLDVESNPTLDVTVNVDDPILGITPDASVSLSIAVIEHHKRHGRGHVRRHWYDRSDDFDDRGDRHGSDRLRDWHRHDGRSHDDN